jgi:type VI secretion system secreted protein Hcp
VQRRRAVCCTCADEVTTMVSNRIRMWLGGVVLAASTCLASVADAAQVSFLKVDGIDGESADAQNPKEIQVTSFTFGVVQSGTAAYGGGGGAGKATFHDFTFVHRYDAASPKLFTAAATGTRFKDVKLTVRRHLGGPTQQVVPLRIRLYDVLVTSVRPTMAPDSESMLEEVRLTFSKIDIEYTPVDAAGKPGAPVKVSYDLKTNRAS